MTYLRLILISLVLVAGVLALSEQPGLQTTVTLAAGAVAILTAVLLEARIRQGDPRTVLASGVGLILGMGLALLVLAIAARLPIQTTLDSSANGSGAFGVLLLVAVLAYLGAVVGRSVADDLTLFHRADPEGRARGRYLVGEKSLIDGRIVKLAESPILSGEIIVPRFVVDQLNEMAASHIPVERFRGERGLESLRRLEQNRMRAVYIRELDLLHGEIEGVLDYAVEHDARIVTHNEPMIEEAGRRGIPIIDLNEVAAMLEPEVLSGDEVVVRLVKPGKEKDQAVGYLDNGNMVVVEDARDDIGRTLRVAVTGLHETRAGTLIFAKKRGAPDDVVSEGASRP